ncbi:MAG: 3-oxoacyl-ACP reductase FabG [Spirochaetota bacterium]|nr:MAG: 3-oxoacyl-ACP reductase FabG [Spirochaetota bacterium]
MRRNVELTGKVALVTGGSRGIGRQIALTLASQGADIAVNYLRSENDANSVLSEVEECGSRCITVRADVSKSGDVKHMKDIIINKLGVVQILINNAGIARPQPIHEISESDWDELIETNLKSAFLVTQAVLPEMRKKGWGRIVNISSVAAQIGGVVGPHYAASKAGLIGLTHSYASLLSKEGITVNTIAPALIATEMVTANPNARPDLIPVGRFGTVEEVADAVVMLACNGYITGQTININGGWYMV